MLLGMTRVVRWKIVILGFSFRNHHPFAPISIYPSNGFTGTLWQFVYQRMCDDAGSKIHLWGNWVMGCDRQQ